MATLNAKKSAAIGWVEDILVILLGCFIFSISINCFTDPNNISPGGVIGIGQLVGDLTGFPKGVFCLLLNAPIFLWAFIELDWRGLIKNLFATFSLNVLVDLTAPFLPVYRGNMILTSLIAGVIGGVGLGLIFVRGAATGGTDLLATLTKLHIQHISVGKILLCIDGTVVGVSSVVYSIGSGDPYAVINGATYAVILLFVQSKVIDALMYASSAGTGRVLFVESCRGNEIAQKIWQGLGRSVTVLQTKGTDLADETAQVLMGAVRRQEVHRAYDIIKSIDRDAFVIVGTADEISGRGFRELNDDLKRSKFLQNLLSRKKG